MSNSLSSEQIQRLAGELRAQVLGRERRVPHSRATEGTVAEAYAVQREYQQLLQAEGQGAIVGYKIALTSQAMQEMVGVDHPLAGALFQSALRRDGESVNLSDYGRLGLEFEIAVQLDRALGPRKGGHTIETVADAVRAVAPAFELVDDRNADYDKIDAYSLIAENCWNAGVIVGEFVTQFDAPGLPGLATSLTLNETATDQSLVGDVMGHPFEVVAWVANLLLGQGRQLEADMIVMTGSSMKTQFPVAGDEFVFSVDTLGSVAVSTV